MSSDKTSHATKECAGPLFIERTLDQADDLLTQGVRLRITHHDKDDDDDGIIMPWLGFGTYKLGKTDSVVAVVYQALVAGYRHIDTAFIYGGQTTEQLVGVAVQRALDHHVVPSRAHVFITTKHWRNYHGYSATRQCLQLSLQRLQLNYVDLYLMHWPGPGYNTLARRKDHDRWKYAKMPQSDLVARRAETWRAMEDARDAGQCRAIGVSNMTVAHLEALRQTARLWPPAVLQVEIHPLRPEHQLMSYCRHHNIVVQAYASLGGQDTGRAAWKRIFGRVPRPPPPHPALVTHPQRRYQDHVALLQAAPVQQLALQKRVTPAQLLLRWGLDHGCVLIPKTTSATRLRENAAIASFRLDQHEVSRLSNDVRALVMQQQQQQDSHDEMEFKDLDEDTQMDDLTRLCWRNDPMRLLDFD